MKLYNQIKKSKQFIISFKKTVPQVYNKELKSRYGIKEDEK